MSIKNHLLAKQNRSSRQSRCVATSYFCVHYFKNMIQVIYHGKYANHVLLYLSRMPGKIKGGKFTHCFRQIQLDNYRLQSKNNRKLEPSRFSVLAQGLIEQIWSVRSASRENAFACLFFSISLQMQMYFRVIGNRSSFAGYL